MILPPLVVWNKYRLGDSVLCEPVAASLADSMRCDVYVASNYPEVFNNNPTVHGVPRDEGWPDDSVCLDLSKSIHPYGEDYTGVSSLCTDKLPRMFEAAGIRASHIRVPQLYLSQDEGEWIERLKSFFPRKRIGVVLESRVKYKNWPYMKWFVKHLATKGTHVFVFAEELHAGIGYIEDLPVNPVVGLPLRDAIVYLAAMDVVIAPDTGFAHVANALGISTRVVTFSILGDVYSIYDSCEVISTNLPSKLSRYAISPRKVERSLEVRQPVVAKRKEADTIALFRLDGLGGTVTLSDHAKKIHEKFGMKATIISRGYADLFKDNPYVQEVVEVGYIPWHEALTAMKERFSVLVEIRFALPKCHQDGRTIFADSLGHFGHFFDNFPNGLLPLESEKLHHVQITDRQLGFAYETMDLEVYSWEDPPISLPDEYVVFSNGVDRQHQSMRQTKNWNGWSELASISSVPLVQLGTAHDPSVSGSIDLRGKTNISQMIGVIKSSTGVVCTEGGLMHLAHACGANNVAVLRGPTRGKLFEYPGQQMVDSYVCRACWGTKDDWFATCPRGIDSYCMDSITPERVAFHIEEKMYEDLVAISHI